MFGLFSITAGPDQGLKLTLAEGQTLVLGRGPAGTPPLRDRHVGRVHCQVQMQQGKVWLSDSKSTGGTWVNGQKISRQELQPGDVIQIGHTQLLFRWSHADEQSTQMPLE